MNAGVERFADAFAIYASIEFGQPGKDFDNFVEMLDPQFAFFDEIVIELQNNPLTETPPEYFQNLYR